MKDLKLRPTKLEDRDLILKLVNQESVRQASFKTETISKEQNDSFWEKKLKSREFKAFSGFVGEELVCLARIEKKVVSIAVDEKWRNQGIAFRALSSLNLKGCIAEIKPGNEKSLRLFKKLGFKETEEFKGSEGKIVLKKE